MPLPYRLRDLRADSVMELARRVKPAASGPVEYTLPGYFHGAHTKGLGLAGGEVIRRNRSGTVRVRVDAEAYQTLLESAVYALRTPRRTVQLQTAARQAVKVLLDPARAVPG